MNLQQLKQQYRQSLKSMDTEEHIDLMFYRPMGFAWAKLFARLGVSPNTVTVASIFLGVAGGILLYFDQPPLLWLNYVGMLLIIWANTFDSADGQLARMTGQYSQLGRILDGLSGDLWFVTIYFALTLRQLHFGDTYTHSWFPQHPWAIWALAITAGICHAKQAAMADYYRQFHLYFLKGEQGSELDSTAELDRQRNNLPPKGHLWKRITLWFYRNYTANQEVFTPAMQHLRKLLAQRYDSAANIPQAFRNDFRARSLPLMKYTNMLSFNTRIIAMFVAVIIGTPWLYFAFELIVLNAMMIYMVSTHERHCRQLASDLQNGKYEQS